METDTYDASGDQCLELNVSQSISLPEQFVSYSIEVTSVAYGYNFEKHICYFCLLLSRLTQALPCWGY